MDGWIAHLSLSDAAHAVEARAQKTCKTWKLQVLGMGPGYSAQLGIGACEFDVGFRLRTLAEKLKASGFCSECTHLEARVEGCQQVSPLSI